MNNKRIILLLTFILLLSISAVTAADENIEETLKEETTQEVPISTANEKESEILKSTKNEKLNAPDDGTFKSLQEKINNAGDVLILENNYTNTDNFDSKGIVITKSITIDGNGYTINALNKGRIFKITGSNVILKNINFKNGKATNDLILDAGSAVYFDKSGTITNCNFTNNQATISQLSGGAVYFKQTANVTNCNFINNTVNRYGGAIYLNSPGNVRNCNFIGNAAQDNGGAVYFVRSGTIINCNFTGNKAIGVESRGGAVYFSSGNHLPGNVTNCNFRNNTAKYGGGAISMDSGNVSNCNFTNNTAEYGGAIYFMMQGNVINCNFNNNNASNKGGAIEMSYGTVRDCNFTSNTAVDTGGAIKISSGTVRNCNFNNNTAKCGGAIEMRYGNVSNCNFTNNQAKGAYNYGGAIWISRVSVENCNFTNNTAVYGGAVYIYEIKNTVTYTVTKCNFVDNSATYGGAVYWSGINGTLYNCSFINNSATNGGAVYWSDTNGTLSNCNFMNNSAIYQGSAIYWTGTNGILNNCNFTNNNQNSSGFTGIENSGGAVHWSGAKGLLYDCNFINNKAHSSGGGVYWMGTNGILKNSNFYNNYAFNSAGAVLWNAHKGTNGFLTNCTFVGNHGVHVGAVMWAMLNANGGKLTNCTFINNTADGGGGAIDWCSNKGNISNCYFFNNRGSYWYGGAIEVCGDECYISDCDFINNYNDCGGAIYMGYIYGDKGTIKNCRFINNTAKSHGGAIYLMKEHETVFNCTFENNSAPHGGAIRWRGKYGTVYNCSFENNTANNGGAVYRDDEGGYLLNCNFTNNHATPSYISNVGHGGAVLWFSGSNGVIDNCIFENNSAKFAGAIRWGHKNGKINNCYFFNNSADGPILSSSNDYHGGAIVFYQYGSNSELTNCIFIDNHAKFDGGAVYFNDRTSNNGEIIVDKCDFINNNARYGGAININMYSCTVGNCNFKDNIAEVNGGAIYTQSSNTEINNGYFIGNNATYGSAIFSKGTVKINKPNFIYNQAHSTNIHIRNENGKFIATFTAKDNILNAIWHEGDVSDIFIDGVNPKLGAQNSNNGQDVYLDEREFNQIIIVEVLDSNNNVVETANLKTDIYGEVEYTPLKKGSKIVFKHPNDVFYTEIQSSSGIPSLTVEKITITPKVVAGGDVEFEITVTNDGNVNLTNITITEDDFKGLIYKDYIKSNVWTFNGINSWTLNRVLNPGETETLRIIFTAPNIGIYNNTVFANATNVKNQYANASVEVISNLVVEKLTLTDRIYVNETAEFLITVKNIGNTAISNIFVEDSDFSQYLEFIGWVSQNGNWIFDNTNMKWYLADDLQAGESASIIVQFKALQTGELRNNATAGINNLTLSYSYNTTEVLHHHNHNNTYGNGSHNGSNIDEPDTPDTPVNPDTPDKPVNPVKPKKEDDDAKTSESTSYTSGYGDSHATGNPILVLLLVLLSLVLIRRRD